MVLPREYGSYLDGIGSGDARFVYDGRLYTKKAGYHSAENYRGRYINLEGNEEESLFGRKKERYGRGLIRGVSTLDSGVYAVTRTVDGAVAIADGRFPGQRVVIQNDKTFPRKPHIADDGSEEDSAYDTDEGIVHVISETTKLNPRFNRFRVYSNGGTLELIWNGQFWQRGHRTSVGQMTWGTYQVRGIGDNTSYQYAGDTDTEYDYLVEPAYAAGYGNAEVIDCALGDEHSLILTVNGRVLATGINDDGATGQNTAVGALEVYTLIPNDSTATAFTNVKAVAAGANFSVALKNNGMLYRWGNNDDNRGGPGAETDATRPVLVNVEGLPLFDKIFCGKGVSHCTFAVTEDGQLYAIGDNSTGALGLPAISDDNYVTYTRVETLHNGDPLPHVVAVSSFDHSTLMLDNRGRVYVTGSGDNNRFGLGETEYSMSFGFRQITGLPPCKSVTVGGTASGAISRKGDIWTWGDNVDDLMPNGATSTVPVMYDPGNDEKFESIEFGYDIATAISEARFLYVWGLDRPFDAVDDDNDTVPLNIPHRLSRHYGMRKVSMGDVDTILTVSFDDDD